MSGEYISREAAISAVVELTIYKDAPSLNAAVEREYHNGREWIGGVRDALVELGDVPAADVVEVVRCRDCKHRIVNEHYGKRGYLKLKAMCDLDTGDPFVFGRDAGDEDWFCADGKRKEGGPDT